MNGIFCRGYTRSISAVLEVLFITSACHADLTVLQTLEDLENDTPAGKEQITLYVSGSKVRFDKGQSMTSIVLNDKKVTFSIMHEPRQYVVLPHDQIRMDAPGSQAETEPADEFTVESTGQVEKISGFTCHQVRLKERNGIVTELWIAEDALDMRTFMIEFNSFMEFGMAQATKQLEKHPELRGLPIRVIEYRGSKMVRRATIHRVDTAKIPDSMFEVPAGYGEVRMPDLK